MNAQLKHVLDRVERWPEAAQEALVRAAIDIEHRFTGTTPTAGKQSLRELMQASPLTDIDLERTSNRPEFRDVYL